MTTTKLILSLIAVAVSTVFLLFFVPFALNATDTVVNLIGVSVPLAIIIGAIAALHRTSSPKSSNKE